MPRYVSLVKYTTEAIGRVREDGYATRPPATKAFAESVGVTQESMHFMMPGGDWDFMMVLSAPSVEAVLAMGSFARASGTIERSALFELFSGEQLDAAIARSNPQYSPPGT